ncbi:unnamed protein product [Notodromas monacha]|uniref:Uncharacterized protein n=1 Tax=Notodromas monacha TaxID=399045 RepID=A0A7R9BL32_9CRUS|nr:unnamed protein product [Notodromas monacha]CAG0916630.1 unnamed protein product [Notodromas monacha]
MATATTAWNLLRRDQDFVSLDYMDEVMENARSIISNDEWEKMKSDEGLEERINWETFENLVRYVRLAPVFASVSAFLP